MIVHFPAYRNFVDARIDAIDAMTALIMGTRLSIKELQTANPTVRLPELHEEIAGITRLNRTASDAANLLKDGEIHLVYMAIPYALSVYGSYLVAVAHMLREDGHEPVSQSPQPDLNKLTLDDGHEYIVDCCSGKLDENYLSLFHFSRQIRNRIIHNGATAGSHIKYDQLPSKARTVWEELSKRPFPQVSYGDKMAINDSELIAILGVCNKLAEDLNKLAAKTISRKYWASLAVKDFGSRHPTSFRQKDRLQEHLEGYVFHLYRPLKLTPDELAEVIKQYSEH